MSEDINPELANPELANPELANAELANAELANLILTETFNLNYSVVGYEDEGIPISDSFTLIKNKCEEKGVDITFISFADTELKGNKIDEWVVETDKGNFYYAPIFKNRVEGSNEEDERLVNDYYFFKNVLSETAPLKSWGGTPDEHALLSNPRSAQLAYVLDNSFIYRICCVDRANDDLEVRNDDLEVRNDDLEVRYKDNVLIVTIPKNWFKFENTNSNTDKLRPYTTIKYDEKKCLYTGDGGEKLNISTNTKDFPSNQANIESLKKHIEEISIELRKEKVPIKDKGEKEQDIYAEGFARLILSLAYLSKLMHNCWIESIPSVVANIANKPRCLGVFIWGYLNNKNNSQSFESPYSIYFRLLADKLCACYANKYIKPLKTALQVRKEATKAAKAAIIARNLSHNLGSHVMFYIKQKLESVQKILQTGVLEDVIKAKDLKELSAKIQEHGNKIPFLVGLGRFINYLQERQDFIATVATDYIPYRTTINFKDAIYDELKLEKRAQRHKTPETEGTMPDNLLLNYIAYSEGFRSSDDIELWFGDTFDGGNSPEDVPTKLREFNIALPGGNMGRQAFFSIMENIIRNTAKHDGSRAIKNRLKFRFNKLEPTEITEVVGYTLREKETHGINNGYYLREGDQDEEHLNSLTLLTDDNQNIFEKCQNDLYFLGITVELDGDAQHAIESIKKGLRRAYITSDGQMDEECKGLKEIRISAAWLRSYELDDEIPADEPPAVAIRKTSDKHLQYIICLPKPKRVAFVKNITKEEFDPTKYEHLKKDGCQVFSKEDNVKKIADYDLVVIDQEIKDEEFKKLQNSIGAKILKCTKKSTEDKDNINIDDILKNNDVVKKAYEEWLHDTLNIEKGQPLPKISILDVDSSEKVDIEDSVRDFVQNSGTSEKRNSFYTDCIIFNHHYPGQPNKENETDRELYAQASYVEAISGGNSTERLIRHDKRNFEWYVKHVIAGKTKVAIFDERIYDMIMPKNAIIKISEDDKKAIRNRTTELLTKGDVSYKDLIDFVKKELSISDLIKASEIINSSSYSDDNVSPEKLASQIIAYKENQKRPDFSLAWKFREKGIWAFNIKRVDNTVQIIGYNVPVTNPIGLYSQDYETQVMATIEMKDNTIIINPSENDNWKFDFITIHQGILDKIYGAFNIKKNDKTKITELLFDFFSKKKKTEITTDNGAKELFLPQFIIHSGRSKPNKEDMPQKQPFLQFSALDHALRDCKYTLTELLYSAHYEQSDNNN